MKISQLLEKVIEKIKLTPEEEQEIKLRVDNFIKKFKKERNIAIVIGGSFAKKTLIRKQVYDVDIFVVFPKTKKNLSAKLEKILKKNKIKAERLKGSRDYFQVKLAKNLVVELIPILKIKEPKEAENITDASLFHVDYVLKKIKLNEKLADEIKLAKAFCRACDCYGAESYIRGFSGYALEILVCYYGSFLNFVKAASRWKSKEIIDPEKHYKNKEEILEKLNYAKLVSPLVLIDPVQASRNVTSALDEENFKRFIEACKNFLARPSEKFFFKHKVVKEKWQKEAKKRKAKFFVVEAMSVSKKRDIAGAKLKKFFNFLCKLAELNDFKILEKYFDFDDKTLKANFYFIIKEPTKEKIITGPPVYAKKQFIDSFKKKWKSVFIKNKRFYAKAKRKITNFKQLLAIPKKTLREMKIKSVRIA
ncbi:MAG: nucleotidyltransferase domain-containing protein [Candidatus Pacearchaeota archaeon]